MPAARRTRFGRSRAACRSIIQELEQVVKGRDGPECRQSPGADGHRRGDRNARSMWKNRAGRPRSRISRTGHGSSAANETYVAVLASVADVAPPYSREKAAITADAPEIPPQVEIPDHQPFPVRAVDDGKVVVAALKWRHARTG